MGRVSWVSMIRDVDLGTASPGGWDRADALLQGQSSRDEIRAPDQS